MNDYQFDAIYAEMKAQTELLTAISLANRWAAFSDEELDAISGHKNLALSVDIKREAAAELARRKVSEQEIHNIKAIQKDPSLKCPKL
jgi:hypothetical protein